MAQRNRIPVAWMKVYDSADNYKASCVDYAEAAVQAEKLALGHSDYSLKLSQYVA